MTNIFSMAVANKYRITYDNNLEVALIVHVGEMKIRFQRTSSGIYVLKIENEKTSDMSSTPRVTMMNTLDENKSFYTEQQFARAKKARDLYHTTGNPSIKDLKAMLQMNLIRDGPVTTADIDIAEKMFGPDISTAKGKTTRKQLLPVVDDYIEIPKELISSQRDVILCLDGMYVNGLTFLTTISKNMYYSTAQYIAKQKSDIYQDAIEHVLRIYNMGGFQVRKIWCDNEFCPLMNQLENKLHICMNHTNASEHVPEAEQSNRVIKERIQAVYHRLPYNHLP